MGHNSISKGSFTKLPGKTEARKRGILNHQSLKRKASPPTAINLDGSAPFLTTLPGLFGLQRKRKHSFQFSRDGEVPFCRSAEARLPTGVAPSCQGSANPSRPGEGGRSLRRRSAAEPRPRGLRVPAETPTAQRTPGPRREAGGRGSTYSDTIRGDSTSAA